jgi:hypothetical protein
MLNNDLLAEAIADAKAVRATALANAKQTLEEAFSGRFDEMLGEKLDETSDKNISVHILKE